MFPEISEEILILVLGLGFSMLWVAARAGLWKRWYWRQRRSVYPYLPIGLLFLIYPYQEDLTNLLQVPMIFVRSLPWLLALIALWWIVLPPSFIKPRWVRWVERHPDKVYQAMAESVGRGEVWQEHILSQEAVDRWAKSLSRSRR